MELSGVEENNKVIRYRFDERGKNGTSSQQEANEEKDLK